MKRQLCLILAAATVFALSGCGETKPAENGSSSSTVSYQTRSDVSFTTERTTYSTEDTVINYTIKYTGTGMRGFSTDAFRLQMKKKDEWKTLSFDREATFEDRPCILSANEEADFKIELDQYFDLPLKKGEYRIEKDEIVSNVFTIE